MYIFVYIYLEIYNIYLPSFVNDFWPCVAIQTIMNDGTLGHYQCNNHHSANILNLQSHVIMGGAPKTDLGALQLTNKEMQ